MPPKGKAPAKNNDMGGGGGGDEDMKPLKSSMKSSSTSTKLSSNNNDAKSSSSNTGNKLPKDEKELFMKCLQAEQRTLSHEELQAAMPNLDVVEKMSIANSLIARGMLQIKRLDNELFYTAIDKSQQKLNSTMSMDEKLIYDNIVSSGNTGIWTKTLKMRTNLHQSNINKALKSMEGKNLIKSVKSAKFPTRKIYMLYELQPSIELSGGPWYTDSELDTEFIGVLLRSIHQYLLDRSYPTSSSSSDNNPPRALLYPTSHTPYLPTTVHDVLAYLKQSKIVQEGTDLSTEHILTLMDVLIYDGLIERITVGTAKCEGQEDLSDGSINDGNSSYCEAETNHNSNELKRSGGKLIDNRNRKKPRVTFEQGKKKLPFEDSFDTEMNSNDEAEENEDEDEDEDDFMPKSKKHNSKSRRRNLPPNEAFVYRALRTMDEQDQGYNNEKESIEDLYKIQEPPKLSGFFDMPCGHCPSFDFCSSKGKAWQFKGLGSLGSQYGIEKPSKLPKIGLAGIGAGFSSIGGLGSAGGVAPVNPADCVYFTEWLEF